MRGATMDFLVEEIFIAGARRIREIYGEEPVIISTSGTSPCTGCPTMSGLDGLMGGEGMNRFYDYLLIHPELIEVVDAFNQNVTDNKDGFGGADGIHVPSTWGNYDLIRGKLDNLDLYHVPVIAAESWITWDQGRPATDVNGDGVMDELDAYDKAVTILGQCIGRGLNTFNLPWSDNSSDWAMGLTKRRDYNGRIAELEPAYVHPAKDGGPAIVTRKVQLRGGDSNFTFGELPPNNVIFTAENHINPADPNHLHYYVWRWYAQIAGGTDEVVRHAIAGERDNDISAFGRGFTGSERYRLSSYNRTREEFTVLLYANGASGTDSCALSIPGTIQTGWHYHTGKSKIDFRGEGFQDGESYVARIETKDISRQDGSDQDIQVFKTPPAQVIDGRLTARIPKVDRFTKVTFIRQ